MLKKLKIGTKLIGFFLLIGIVPLPFLGVTSYNNASEALLLVQEYK